MTQPGASSQSSAQQQGDLQDEVHRLEEQLAAARRRLKAEQQGHGAAVSSSTTTTDTPSRGILPLRRRRRQRHRQQQQQQHTSGRSSRPDADRRTRTGRDTVNQHYLLLLSDSALPLGSFAFSSGLESYREHARAAAAAGSLNSSNNNDSNHQNQKTPSRPAWSFAEFLPLSLSSYASTSLPFVLAAHREPHRLAELDDALDAATICTVGRRASCAQGRALLGIWEKSLVGEAAVAVGGAAGGGGGFGMEVAEDGMDESDEDRMQFDDEDDEDEEDGDAEDDDTVDIIQIIKDFSTLLRRSGSTTNTATPTAIPPVSAHLAPLFGAISRALGLGEKQTAYVFMLSHVKALVSAAIRAGMFGPFQAQKILAGREVREYLPALIEREWDTPVEHAGQSSPVVDLWIGRHEILYSRVFNS